MKIRTPLESFGSRPKILLLAAVLVLLAVFLLPLTGFADPFHDTSGRVLQVQLANARKISQFNDIDSSPQGYGKNACGLVAAAAAVGGSNWLPQVDRIAAAAGDTYSPYSGIQPADYVSALQKVFGARNVRVIHAGSVSELYQELYKGNIVIVDVKVSSTTDRPSAWRPNFAHFARVLGMDMNTQEIYIQNTLSGEEAYWTVSFQDFSQAWEHPEITASDIPDTGNAEAVTRWAVVLDGSLIQDGV